MAEENAPDADEQVTVDLDGVLVTAHCAKQVAEQVGVAAETPGQW